MKQEGGESFQAFFTALTHFKPFGQLDTKIARARAQDEPVLYAHILPGLDVLLCSVRGAQPPYPGGSELRRRCIESIAHALEQPIEGLEHGGYWYEADGFGFLVFASRARERILAEFGASRPGISTTRRPPRRPRTAPPEVAERPAGRSGNHGGSGGNAGTPAQDGPGSNTTGQPGTTGGSNATPRPLR